MKSLERNVKFFLLAVGVVFVWRGIWGLADLFLFPATPVLSFVISIVIGIVILYFNDLKKKDLHELA